MRMMYSSVTVAKMAKATPARVAPTMSIDTPPPSVLAGWGVGGGGEGEGGGVVVEYVMGVPTMKVAPCCSATAAALLPDGAEESRRRPAPPAVGVSVERVWRMTHCRNCLMTPLEAW